MKLQDKVVIITGTGAGIGKASALLFAREGAKLCTVDFSEAAGSATLAQLRAAGHDAIFVQADTAKEADTARFLGACTAHYGRLDVIFNCAGIVLGGSIATQTMEEWQRTLDIDLTGVFLGCKHALQQFLKQGEGGCIINMASVAGVMGVKDRGAYCAAKAGVIGLTKSVALDFSDRQIRCNCICPGTVATESWSERVNSSADPAAARAAFVARQPIGRVGTPEEIAEAALYLATAGYVTGLSLVIDGGMSV